MYKLQNNNIEIHLILLLFPCKENTRMCTLCQSLADSVNVCGAEGSDVD